MMESFNEPLIDAVSEGDLEKVKALIEGKKTNVECKSVFAEKTPLFIASERGDFKMVQYFIDYYISLKDKDSHIQQWIAQQIDKDGRTPLWIACQKNCYDVVCYLISFSSSLEQGDKDGVTPLITACLEGHLNVVKYLIKHSASLTKASESGSTPLSAACQNNHLEVVRYLIKCHNSQKVSLDLVDREGYTPLHVAAAHGNLTIVQELLQHGADKNLKTKKSRTTEGLASENGHHSTVASLQCFNKPLAKHLFPLRKECWILIRMWPPTIESSSKSSMNNKNLDFESYSKTEALLKEALLSPDHKSEKSSKHDKEFSEIGVLFEKYRPFSKAEINIGHISISIRDGSGETYISHWPKEEPSNPLPVEAVGHSLVEDTLCENGLPAFQIMLYSLDIKKMVTHYQEIGKNAKWFIGGDVLPTKKIGRKAIHSCSSYVYELLEKGGLFDHLLPKNERLNSPITPTEVTLLAHRAQIVEQTLYPETIKLFEHNLLAVEPQLIEKAEAGFDALKSFIQKNPDYCALYAAYYSQKAIKLFESIRNSIETKASQELLSLVQSLEKNMDESIFKNMFLPGFEKQIEYGANLSAHNDEGYNALHCAILKKHRLPVIEKLLEKFPEAVNSYCKPDPKVATIITPLDLALKVGDQTLIELLQAKNGVKGEDLVIKLSNKDEEIHFDDEDELKEKNKNRGGINRWHVLSQKKPNSKLQSLSESSDGATESANLSKEDIREDKGQDDRETDQRKFGHR